METHKEFRMPEISFYKNNKIGRIRFYITLYVSFLISMFLCSSSIHNGILNIGEYFFADESVGISYYTLRTDYEIPTCDPSINIETGVELQKKIIIFHQLTQKKQPYDDLAETPQGYVKFQEALKKLQSDCQKKHQDYEKIAARFTPALKMFRSIEKTFSEIFQLHSQAYHLFLSVILFVLLLVWSLIFIPFITSKYLKLISWYLSGFIFIFLGIWPWLESLNQNRFLLANAYLQQLNSFVHDNQQDFSFGNYQNNSGFELDSLEGISDTARIAAAIEDNQNISLNVTEIPEKKESLPNSFASDINQLNNEILNFINDWTVAWAERDVKKYLSFYSKAFKPSGAIGYQQWTDDRKIKLKNNTQIKLSVQNIKISQYKNKVTVSFIQKYKSKQHADTTKKIMVLQKESEQWKIISEQTNS